MLVERTVLIVRSAAQSLTLPARAGEPWATWTDRGGCLWLEEYPENDDPRGEQVLDGHIFPLYGVDDYRRLTSDERAAEIFDAAAITVPPEVPPGPHPADPQAVRGHPRHRLRRVRRHAAGGLPGAGPDGHRAVRARDTRTGYTYDRNGAVRDARKVTFAAVTELALGGTAWVNGEFSYHVSGGELGGYWLAARGDLAIATIAG
ncbi:hypothetical protein NMK34_27440 [Micromonospora sp. BRA006-A]|uniref:D-glucuronyl C5-epimerase family protein n=1 Tax=Micromonospora sp. BRA006-A TaxID=2962860 RepID=UPI00296F2CDF|nr:D-glucuronyl C5-epimerase family protein [Micromonospora sp. BRA006-A]MDW3850351.1 hypothetical protein [Micromonospora sp. BRA006-A]